MIEDKPPPCEPLSPFCQFTASRFTAGQIGELSPGFLPGIFLTPPASDQLVGFHLNVCGEFTLDIFACRQIGHLGPPTGNVGSPSFHHAEASPGA
jgi:hypothetical protein